MASLKVCALLLLVASASAARPLSEESQEYKDRRVLKAFIAGHKAAGTHEHEAVPEVIRGERFTEDNLLKYFGAGPADGAEHQALEQVAEPAEEGSARSLLQVDVDKVIQIGKEVWKFVEDNKPVVNANTDYAGAVPNGLSDWRALAGWKNTESNRKVFSWVNGFNVETVHIAFKMIHTYAGKYNGKGKYVTQAGPALDNIDVSWGYTVDVSAKAYQPLNVGTVSDPVAQIDVEVTIRASTVLKDTTQKCRGRFKGSGEIEFVSCNFY